MAKKTALIQASVGRRRVDSFVNSTEASFTLGARDEISAVLTPLLRTLNKMDTASADVIHEALQPTFALSQSYVPVKTGNLKRSGFLIKTTFRGIPTVQIGYGNGGNPPYAALVHEKLEYKHAAPTRAKFLQAAIEEDADNIQARILRGYKTVQEGGTP